MDVSSASDKCWQKGVLAMLRQAKVDRYCHNYSNRVQPTVVDGLKINFKEIKAGIPQG